MGLMATETAIGNFEEVPVNLMLGDVLSVYYLSRVSIYRRRKQVGECFFLDLFEEKKSKEAKWVDGILKNIGFKFSIKADSVGIKIKSDMEFHIAGENKWYITLNGITIGRVEEDHLIISWPI